MLPQQLSLHFAMKDRKSLSKLGGFRSAELELCNGIVYFSKKKLIRL